jgi:hypothetical protein
MKGVLILCLMVYVWIKKSSNFFFVMLLIFMNFFSQMVHEKKCKNENLSHKVSTF